MRKEFRGSLITIDSHSIAQVLNGVSIAIHSPHSVVRATHSLALLGTVSLAALCQTPLYTIEISG